MNIYMDRIIAFGVEIGTGVYLARILTWDGSDRTGGAYGGVYVVPAYRRRFSVAVTRWSRSTQLLYIEPG